MYIVSVEDNFSSAHQLREYQGKCENLHGHNWKVKVSLSGNELDKAGMLIDFGIMKKELKQIMDYLDHKFLNDTEPFDKLNPSAENIAHFIFEKMSSAISCDYPKIKVHRVDVWESFKSCASYIGE